jgi:hypothetical protein
MTRRRIPCTTPRAEAHRWEFASRFRRGTFGWKSQPAIQRVRQAVSEIKGAIRLANRTPSDPRTLTRAARDFADKRPEFALEAGLAALRWLVDGYGYEVTGADVWGAYANTMKAAEKAGRVGEARERIRRLVAAETFGERFVTRILGREIDGSTGER